jgi:hypothetical protein
VSASLTRTLATTPHPSDIFAPVAPVRWSSALLVATLASIIVLSFTAQPRRTGDAHQYLAMALLLSEVRPPSLDPVDAASITTWFASQPAVSGFPDGARAIRQPSLIRYGRQEFSHVWMYPLLAAPLISLAAAVGAHPIVAFTAMNAFLLGAAVWAVSRVFGTLAAFAILASPLVWFVARAQVEVFTVSLLCLAMVAAASSRWGWAGIATAIAATQNLPIAATLPLIWAYATINWFLLHRAHGSAPKPTANQFRTALGFAIASSGIAALHPAYYLWRLGVITPQQLNGGFVGGVPSLQRFLAPILDPDIGLLAWLPLTALLGIVGTASAIRAARTESPRTLLPIACAGIMAIWFLFVFAQSTNVNSGGTVHVSRYALWLIPLTLPAIAVVTKPIEERLPTISILTAIALVAVYLIAFHPDQAERYVEHSPQANWIISHVPALYQPLPEVFVERTLHVDGGPHSSAASADCSLIFLVAAQPTQPCSITSSEEATAQDLFARNAESVWIRRQASGSSVSVALTRQ